MDARFFVRYLWFFPLFMMLAISTVSARAMDIALISHKTMRSMQQLTGELSNRLKHSIEYHQLDEKVDWHRYHIVILVGETVLKRWQPLKQQVAIATFVNRQAVMQYQDKLVSAIYIEPPLERQLALAKTLLGEKRPLAILVASRKGWHAPLYKGQSLDDSAIFTYFTDEYDNLNHALVDALHNTTGIVGVYDPQLFSSINIKNILITAYRRNKPLIGPSSAYIKAGALASTYSDLQHVAQRLVDIIQQGTQQKKWPKPDYNPYFSVRYNDQVGRSLNLSIPDKESLTESVRRKME